MNEKGRKTERLAVETNLSRVIAEEKMSDEDNEKISRMQDAINNISFQMPKTSNLEINSYLDNF